MACRFRDFRYPPRSYSSLLSLPIPIPSWAFFRNPFDLNASQGRRCGHQKRADIAAMLPVVCCP